MGLVQKVRDAVSGTTRKNVAQQEINGSITVNALCSAYENLFAQVRPLINDMKVVFPYGIGRNGAKLPAARTPELVVLETPNEDMDWTEFSDAMFATWLTESELNVHVHKTKGGRVYGYSILPPNCRQIRAGGEVVFQVYSENGGMEVLTRDEVATLRFSRSPRNIDKGVSPAGSVFTWSQIDDLMAQYQKAYLENGAIPASITIIRASTREKFDDARKDLEKQYSGAHNKNKTLYLWRQFVNDDGTERDQVEVKTIQGNNSTLAIKEIIDIINDRLNKAIGVSNFILGDDSSAKYDNAELSDLQFTKRRVYPALVSFWGQFQHELDRITGGLGYSISFDLDIPELTDRLKTKAETAEKNTGTLINMIKAGASPSASVEALGLSEAWIPVANGIYARVLSDLQQLSTRNETNSLKLSNPTPKLVDSKTETSTPTPATDKTMDAADISYPVFAATEVREKHIYDELMKIAEGMAREYNVPTQEVVDAIMEVLTEEANLGANAGAENVADITSGEVSAAITAQLEDDGFHVSEEFTKNMEARVDDLVSRYSEDTAAKMKEIIGVSKGKGLSASEIRKELRQVLPLDMSRRAEVIARNETVHAFRAGRLSNDEYLAERFNIRMGKQWHIVDEDACDICKAMDEQIVALSEPFPEHVHTVNEDGEEVDISFDHTRWNDGGETPDAHTNCRCYFNEVILDD